MIGFESDLTGAEVVEAVTQVHELFSDDMTPQRIKDVVEKFENESGGYKEIEAFDTLNGLKQHQPLIVITALNTENSVTLSLEYVNLKYLLRTHLGNPKGFHRIKFIEGAVFAGYNEWDYAGGGVFKDVYIDLNRAQDVLYGEFLIPGILKGVFTYDKGTSDASISVRSILCPAIIGSIGKFIYTKPTSNSTLAGIVELEFFSDALLIYPSYSRISRTSYTYDPTSLLVPLKIDVQLNFEIASGYLMSTCYCRSSAQDITFPLYPEDDRYENSFYLHLDGAFHDEFLTGSFSINGFPSPTMSDYLDFISDTSFINR